MVLTTRYDVLLTLYPMAACHGKAETGASWPPTTFGNSLKLIPHSSRLATLTFIVAGVDVVVVIVVVVDCVVVVLDSLVVVVGLGVVRGVVMGGLQNTQVLGFSILAQSNALECLRG